MSFPAGEKKTDLIGPVAQRKEDEVMLSDPSTVAVLKQQVRPRSTHASPHCSSSPMPTPSRRCGWGRGVAEGTVGGR